MAKISSYTRIQVTVEVDGSAYGEDWNLGALVKQSGDEAINGLRNKLRDMRVKIIGDPKVLTITHIEEK